MQTVHRTSRTLLGSRCEPCCGNVQLWPAAVCDPESSRQSICCSACAVESQFVLFRDLKCIIDLYPRIPNGAFELSQRVPDFASALPDGARPCDTVETCLTRTAMPNWKLFVITYIAHFQPFTYCRYCTPRTICIATQLPSKTHMFAFVEEIS